MDINYKNWITSIATRFKQAQIKAATQVNAEMLRFYWELGKDVLQLSEASAYGDKVLQKIRKMHNLVMNLLMMNLALQLLHRLKKAEKHRDNRQHQAVKKNLITAILNLTMKIYKK